MKRNKAKAAATAEPTTLFPEAAETGRPGPGKPAGEGAKLPPPKEGKARPTRQRASLAVEERGIAVREATPPAERPADLLSAIVAAARDPAVLPEKMHALLDVRQRLMAEEARVQFTAAFVDMTAELPEIGRDGKIIIEEKQGKKGRTTLYATYQNIQRAVKPVLRKHRFALLLLPDVGPGGVGVLMRGELSFVCETQWGRLVHSERCVIAAPLETGGSKNNVQGIGSSLSYTKRYATVALLDLVSFAPEDRDDDGKATSGIKSDAAAPSAITEDQAASLREAIEAAGVPIETFCKKYNVPAVSDLPAPMLKEALAALEAYRNRDRGKAA